MFKDKRVFLGLGALLAVVLYVKRDAIKAYFAKMKAGSAPQASAALPPPPASASVKGLGAWRGVDQSDSMVDEDYAGGGLLGLRGGIN